MNIFFTTSKIKVQDLIPVDYSFDADSMGPASNKAVNDIKQVIGKDTLALLESFLGTAGYDDPGDDARKKALKESVDLLAAVLYNMAMYHQFIWLMLRVSSNSITVMKGENEQTLNKGQQIEARESLLEFAYSALNDLVEYLTENKTVITDDNEVKVWEASEQYTETKDLLFDGFRDFAKYSGLAIHAAFFFNARHILKEVVSEMVVSRVGKLSDILNPEEGEADVVLIGKLKRAVSREVSARACLELTINLMPDTIRQTVDREMYATKKSDEEIRTGIARRLGVLAAKQWDGLDAYLATVVQDETNTEKFTVPDMEKTLDTGSKTAGFL